MGVLNNWEQWKDFLGERINQAKNAGLDEDVINELAQEVGDYLAKEVDPKNEQQRVLHDLWSVANEEEQQAIANVMVKLVQK